MLKSKFSLQPIKKHLIFCSLKQHCQNSLPRCLARWKLQLVSVQLVALMYVFVHLTECHLLQGQEGGIAPPWTTSFCQQKVIQLGSRSWVGTLSPTFHLLGTAASSVPGEDGKVFNLLPFSITFWLQFLESDICFASWLGLYSAQTLCRNMN